jgi:hypothetical protein
MPFFFFYKIGEQVTRTAPVLRVGTSGLEENVGKGYRRVNMVQKMCTHVCKWKNDTC